jgi:hypothetical protein
MILSAHGHARVKGKLFGRSIHFNQRVRVDLFRQTVNLPKLSDIPKKVQGLSSS